MNIRRTSGEIVNATLLETFLALVFLIFALALFESQRADDAVAEVARAPSRPTFDSLASRLADMERAHGARADSVRRLIGLTDSLRGVLASKYPPDCEPNAEPPEWLTLKFVGPSQIDVVAHRSQFGIAANQPFSVSPSSFGQTFARARQESEARRCRFLVRVEDTRNTNKEDFKRSLSAVTSVFRPRNYLR